MIVLRKPVADDIVRVVEDIRPVDIKELELFTFREPLGALNIIRERSQEFRSVVHITKGEHRVAGVVGYVITDMMFKIASPFFITTNYTASHPVLFGKYSKEVMPLFKGKFLRNWVLDENETAKKWLDWLGFNIHGIEYMWGKPVRMFTKDCR